jgi:hypothetical protein
MLKVFDGGGDEEIYVFSLRTGYSYLGFEEEQDRFNRMEFADKGRDSGEDEIVDIRFTAAQVRKQTTSELGSELRFVLFAQKLNADGTADEGWESHGWSNGKIFNVGIIPVATEAPPTGGTGRAMTEVVSPDDFSPDDFSPDAVTEELGAPLAEVL